MKLGRVDVRGNATLGMELRFETQDPTSYSGLILFQHFFSLIGIKERLWRCFRHLKANPIYGHHVMVMLLVVHLIIGHRRLRDLDYYRCFMHQSGSPIASLGSERISATFTGSCPPSSALLELKADGRTQHSDRRHMSGRAQLLRESLEADRTLVGCDGGYRHSMERHASLPSYRSKDPVQPCCRSEASPSGSSAHSIPKSLRTALTPPRSAKGCGSETDHC